MVCLFFSQVGKMEFAELIILYRNSITGSIPRINIYAFHIGVVARSQIKQVAT